MKNYFTLFFLLHTLTLASQNFINGDFESNNADTLNGDYINLTAQGFNDLMLNCHSYGTEPNIDILLEGIYGSPQNGQWFIALTGGESDRVNLELTTPLIMGNTYTISFYDKEFPSFDVEPIKIGLSTAIDQIGEIIHTTDSLAQTSWTERSFTFVAPNNGQFISVFTEGSISNWVLIDNFSFSNTTSNFTIIDEKNISLVQNPVSNSIRLKSTESIFSGIISIYSANGRLIKRATFDNLQNFEVDVSDLTSGFYFLNIAAKDSPSGSLKFIKT